jgi:hypothetical protein
MGYKSSEYEKKKLNKKYKKKDKRNKYEKNQDILLRNMQETGRFCLSEN